MCYWRMDTGLLAGVLTTIGVSIIYINNDAWSMFDILFR